ncbi:APC family permease [Microbacterium sp. zg-B96]|uniref:APC family permease n=1 Tax=Microbacterium sp. zg-B96 TaxID=3049069 RepID=UPI00254D70DD|nr:APC family permease [Microbacterium sp. zg-B96]WIM16524.1 APC family permease [Microbacterium sp. zg-B96]
MSALSDAISRRQPAASLSARSPLHGLRRGSVRTVDLVAQSVAAVAPAGVLLTHSGGLVGHLGSFSFVALLLTAAVVVLVALTMSVFARRISAAGGIYTFVTRGLGPIVGIAAGAAIALGYASVAIDTLRSGVRRLGGLITAGNGEDAATTVLLALGCTAIIVVVIVCGARASTRVMLVIESVAVAAILAVTAVVFAGTGWDLAPLVPDPGAMPSPSALAGGIGIALVSFVGFESGATLGPESRRPLASVPRALVWTAVAVAIVYLFGTGAQLSAAASGCAGRTSALVPASVLESAPWTATLIDAVIAASWLVCTLACTNALVRLVFTMAREGILPAWLGRTSQRFATPHRAALTVGGVVATGTILQAWAGHGSLLDATIALATPVGFLIAYLLVCAAAVPYLLRVGEFTLRESWPAIVGTVALGAVAVTEVMGVVGLDRAALAIIAVVLAMAVLGHVVRFRAGRTSTSHSGAYDTPVAADALATPGDGLPRP